jgi:hypothetical protein
MEKKRTSVDLIREFESADGFKQGYYKASKHRYDVRGAVFEVEDAAEKKVYEVIVRLVETPDKEAWYFLPENI